MLWTAAGGSDGSVELSSRKTSISDMISAVGCTNAGRLEIMEVRLLDYL